MPRIIGKSGKKESNEDSVITSVEGFMGGDELQFLVENAKDKDVVEIGLWKGRTTVNLLQVCRSLVCVDHFRGSPVEGGKQEHEWQDDVLQQMQEGRSLLQSYLANVAWFFPKRYVRFELLVMGSKQAAETLHPSRTFDLVFVDGDHSYEHCKEDILLWQPRVRPGGLLCGHDYGLKDWQARPGVDRAVNELFPQLEGVVGSIWFKRL